MNDMVATDIPFQNSLTSKENFSDQVVVVVAASSSTRSLRVMIFNKFSFFVKEKYCWDHSDPKCFFQSLMVLNQPS